MGKIFVLSMLLSAFIAMIVAWLPGHESPFLFTIGIFSSYFVIGGYRAKKYLKPNVQLTFDKRVSLTMILTGVAMIAYPIVFHNSINVVLTVFGAAGIFSGIMDLRSYRDLGKLRKAWLQAHIGKMMGGLISAVTAFVVVNGLLPGVWAWFGASIPGVAFIVYWTRRVNKGSFR